VSQIPGTTRDYVEQYTVLGKIPVNVVDTAGLRHTHDPIEQEGVKLALSRIAEADLVIFLYDASLGWTGEDQQMLNLVKEEKIIVVGNKIDKGKTPNQHPKAYFISAKEKTGLEKLIEAIHQVMNVTEPPKLLVSQRQMGLLEKTLNDIRDALEHLGIYAEVAADDLFSALRNLTALTGGDLEEDLLSTVFSNFCIGK
jgi:tRNA modification GTPase